MSYVSQKFNLLLRAWQVLWRGNDSIHLLLYHLLGQAKRDFYESEARCDALVRAAAAMAIRHEKEIAAGAIDRSQAVDYSRPIKIHTLFGPHSK